MFLRGLTSMEIEQNKKKRIGVLAFIAFALLCTVIHIISVVSFNNTEHTSVGLDTKQNTYMDVHYRGSDTSSWLKRDMGVYGKIYDASITNNTNDTIKTWSLRVNITNYCYLNQFWNGEVEIHQGVGTDQEVVQTLNLSSYEFDDIKLKYVLDAADVLIPLKKGDYFIYYPAEEFREYPINPGDEVVVGMIMYFEDELDVSDYTLNYMYHRDFTKGIGFAFILVLNFLWIGYVIFHLMSIYAYKKAQKEVDMRIAGISSMADIYEAIYMIDISKNTLTVVGNANEDDKLRPRELGAEEQIRNMFETGAEEEYKDILTEYCDFDKIRERLITNNSFAFEYVSKKYGWSRIRYFAMDREEGKPVEKFLFTIQQINDEKHELEKIRNQVESAKSESNAKSAFLTNITHELKTPIETVISLDNLILRDKSINQDVRNYAIDIRNSSRMLMAFINGILDYSSLEAGKMEMKLADIELESVIRDINNVMISKVINDGARIEFDIAENLPVKVYGDELKLKQILINLMIYILSNTENSGVKVGIYGKNMADDMVHILFSVKDLSMNINLEKTINDDSSDTDNNPRDLMTDSGMGMNLVTGLLEFMGSKLKIVDVNGAHTDFYFELDYKIVDSRPIGKVDWSEYITEDYEGLKKEK